MGKLGIGESFEWQGIGQAKARERSLLPASETAASQVSPTQVSAPPEWSASQSRSATKRVWVIFLACG